MGDLAAHQVSTVSLILLFGLYIFFIIKKFPPRSGRHAFYIGAFWLVLTLLFEFGFGLARGNGLSHLLSEYNILEGRVWILIPVWITIAPYFFYRIKR